MGGFLNHEYDIMRSRAGERVQNLRQEGWHYQEIGSWIIGPDLGQN